MKKITLFFMSVCMMLLTSTAVGQADVQIGSGTSTITGGAAMPVSNYVYNYNQQIITAAEYTAGGGSAGEITKIRYYATNIGTLTVWNQWTVYIGNTSKTEFASTSDWVPLAEMTQVFSGTITAVANDWFEVAFTAPFAYTGGNIVVAVHEYAPNWTLPPTFRSYTSTPNAGIYYRSDTVNPTPATPPANATGRVANVPQIQFECSTCTPLEAPDCATDPFPADGATDVPVGDIVFTWTAPASGPTPTAYNIYAYDDAAGANPFLIGTVPGESIDIEILAYEVDIYWAAVPVNGNVEATGCAVWMFTTEDAPPPPPNDLFADAIALNCGDDVVGTTLFATQDESDAPGTVTGGGTDTSADNDSPWVWYSYTGMGVEEEVTLSTCGTAQTDFDTEIFVYTGTSGNLTLIDDGYDECGGSSENYAAETTFTSDGSTTYYIAVGGYNSSDVGNFHLAVSCVTLSAPELENANAFSYFPNPVKNELKLRAQSNIQNVSIYNMLGQEVLRSAPNALESDVDMNGLQTGAYFVKVTINDATETIRIIKQ